MALALSNTTPRPIGWGYYVLWTGAGGPVPVDDYVELVLRKTGTFPQPIIAYGTVVMFGFTSGSVLVGTDHRGHYFPQSYEQFSNGGSIQLELSQYHANGTPVTGPVIYTAFTFDQVTQLGQLTCVAASATGLDSSKIQRILDAVYRPFPVN